MSVSENKKAVKSSTVHSVVVASKLLEFLADLSSGPAEYFATVFQSQQIRIGAGWRLILI